MTVNGGAGDQFDPNVSGSWVSYTDGSATGIRFQNLDLGAGSDRLIPMAESSYDSLSDIGGDRVVFMRASSASQAIYLVQTTRSAIPAPPSRSPN